MSYDFLIIDESLYIVQDGFWITWFLHKDRIISVSISTGVLYIWMNSVTERELVGSVHEIELDYYQRIQGSMKHKHCHKYLYNSVHVF